ncbi:DUF6624 domain-containing protein [Emticicia sp. 17c]|uniref:DUF6624 domain-containing protein n=1 Tax=Emticicia sp. 17c TaxID=3127704 RepID=UPI00301D219C
MIRASLYIVSLFLSILSMKVNAQDLLVNNSVFFEKKWKADSLFKIGKYKQAEQQYKLAYKHTKCITFHQSVYKSLAELYVKNRQLKSGERSIYRLLKSGYIVKNWFEFLPDTSVLRKQKWAKLKSINEFNKSETAGSNKDLIQLLQYLRTRDQKFRKTEYFDSLRTIYSVETASQIMTNSILKVDSMNTDALKNIISHYGWPSIKQVGYEGIGICWLIVQHADKDVNFQKTALRYIENAVSKGEGSLVNFAYLTDRVLVNSGEKQIFATQFGEPVVNKENKVTDLTFKPLKDPNNVDYLRNAFGLPTAEEYKKYCFERWYGKKQ